VHEALSALSLPRREQPVEIVVSQVEIFVRQVKCVVSHVEIGDPYVQLSLGGRHNARARGRPDP
jgi:hypothetical protein